MLTVHRANEEEGTDVRGLVDAYWGSVDRERKKGREKRQAFSRISFYDYEKQIT